MIDYKLQERKDLCVLFTGVPLSASNKLGYTVGAQLWWLTVQTPPLGGASKDSGKMAAWSNHHKIFSVPIVVTRMIKFWDFPCGTVVKNPPANAGDTGSSPGPGRSHMPQSN